jgi:heat shock protein HtpX
MHLIKRIFLFLVVNALVVTALSIILSVFNVQPYLSNYGLDIPSLAIFCLIYGMVGSLFSLAISRAVAKWSYGVQLIDPATAGPRERWLLQIVHELAAKAGITTMPEVGLYASHEANAFATGPCKSKALVAVSSGLFELMNEDEIEGVLGHEISHIANDDMVTMTLVQGIMNAFVMFASRVIAYILTRGSRENGRGSGSYFLVMTLLQWALFVLAAIPVAFYSRHRECRADDGGAKLTSTDKMVRALEALQRTVDRLDRNAQPSIQTMKIATIPQGIWALFSTHPPLAERIARLRSGR